MSKEQPTLQMGMPAQLERQGWLLRPVALGQQIWLLG